MAIMTYTHLFSCGSLPVTHERLAEGRAKAQKSPVLLLWNLEVSWTLLRGPWTLQCSRSGDCESLSHVSNRCAAWKVRAKMHLGHVRCPSCTSRLRMLILGINA